MNKEKLKILASLGSVSLLLGGLFASFPRGIRKQAGRERGWKCEKCGKRYCDCYLLDCHHKNPEHDGGKDDIENLIILCLLCHAEAHKELGDDDVVKSIMGRYKNRSGGRTRDWLAKNK